MTASQEMEQVYSCNPGAHMGLPEYSKVKHTCLEAYGAPLPYMAHNVNAALSIVQLLSELPYISAYKLITFM